MSIINLMNPAFQKASGGLFSTSKKADVGDVAKRMEEQGVAMLSWADPFKPDPSIPDFIIDETIKQINNGTSSHYFMPIGSPELKKEIVERIERKSGLKLNPDRNIIINPGSDNGLLFALMAWINDGDEVLIADPSYPNNYSDVEILGGIPISIPTTKKNHWHLDIASYYDKLSDKTKAIILCNPNNPTGVCYRKDELEQLAKFCIVNNLVCIVDQAFEDTVYDDNLMINMAQIDGMWQRTVTVCSASKGMGLSGFRIGWMYCNDEIMDKYMGLAVNIQGAASTLSQKVLVSAFKKDQFIGEYVKKFDYRRKKGFEILSKCPYIDLDLPEAGFYFWINVSKLGTSQEVVDYLINEGKINANDGSFYGQNGEGYIRVIYACYQSDDYMLSILEKMVYTFNKLAIEKGLI